MYAHDRILLALDDAHLRTFLADNLLADGHPVDVATCAAEARCRAARCELLVLGELAGCAPALALLRELRGGQIDGAEAALPVVMLQRAGDAVACVRAFDAGADDVVRLPLAYPELRARVRAVTRRGPARQLRRILVGELEVDIAARRAFVAGHELPLSNKEFDLLSALASDPLRVFTKDELLRDVWGFRTPVATRTVDSHACRLRHKLAIGGHRYVTNVWGVGYRLVDQLPAGSDAGLAAAAA